MLLGFDARKAALTTNLSDVLPSTLRELIIRDDLVALGETYWEDRRIYDHVHEFLPKWRTATPLLRQITLRLWDGHYEQMFLRDEKKLQEACEEAGKLLDIITDNLSSSTWARHNIELPPSWYTWQIPNIIIIFLWKCTEYFTESLAWRTNCQSSTQPHVLFSIS